MSIAISDYSPAHSPGFAASDQGHMVVALLFALLVHGVLIWQVGFDLDSKDETPPVPTTIEVTMVYQSTEEEPEDPDYYAQANQVGGGTTSEHVRATSPTPAPFPSPEARLAELSPPISAGRPTAGSPQYLTTEAPSPDKATDVSVAERSADASDSSTTNPIHQDAPRVDAQQLVQQAVVVAGLNAEYGRSFASTSRRKKHEYISANTKAYYAAAYMDAWRRKIERTGNLNYPVESRRDGIYGSLLLEVAILPNGSIDKTIVVRSSGHPVLDNAAIRIVRMAAPFAPFPKEISDKTDVLHITRTWEFRRGDRLTSR